MRWFSIIALTSIFFTITADVSSADDFQLKDGDRVIFLGNTLIERAQEYSEWESQLSQAANGKKIIFRNLGWSGDTVWAESRGLFDPPAAGYKRTQELIQELKPTVIVIGYGTVESFRGAEGVDEFVAQYQQLRKDLLKTNARLIHLSPILMEAASFPKLAEGVNERVETANKNLNLYAEKVREISAESGELFIDFRDAQRNKAEGTLWTENGLHLSRSGYAETAKVLTQQLGGTVSQKDNPELKELIRRKNELFFHRWRPQNFTYLLGFRKHEQGQNAVEIAQFDPLITELEAQIQKQLSP
ncbi:GDSL-type esterase/lipase family protein [Thalassoglobus polymorphus]|uniref:SGNH hydrolase-type esterase domain-containing protein n=1 Tax=Thalassoglobus polymorphus TaxID=2527994 RepID=A0A517QQB0_9PLAN|nr:GDSL-type esterase/lipase family protein [Thalassoglobus polymorphus]QDT33816.1 hypothetical protein Mal48_30710 [Thalassoglobus polymorphus]